MNTTAVLSDHPGHSAATAPHADRRPEHQMRPVAVAGMPGFFPENTPLRLICRRRGWDAGLLSGMDLGEGSPLDDLDAAVALLHRHITGGRTITVLTDFDMDGVTSGLLTYGGLAELGADVELVVPDYRGPREITAADVDRAIALHPDTSLIITCDVGIASNAGIDRAHARGIEVLVTDHHLENREDPCRAEVSLNPNKVASTYRDREICGAQVAAKLLAAYAAVHRRDKIDAIAMLDVFAGMGALADVMPLRGQTRALVRKALALLKLACPTFPTNYWGSWDKAKAHTAMPETSVLMTIVGNRGHDWRYQRLFFGLGILLRNMAAAGKLRSLDDIDAGFIGFSLAPAFNATRRVEADMADSFNIFAPQIVDYACPENGNTPDASARQLLANNELRKKMLAEAMDVIDQTEQPLAPYIYFSDAPAGILGLIASRMAEAHGGPAMVVSRDHAAGSGRAPDWLPLADLVNEIDGATAAGHQHACGVRFGSEVVMVEVVEHIETYIAAMPAAEAKAPDLALHDIPDIAGMDRALVSAILRDTDYAMPGAGEMLDLIRQLDVLEPFGHGFEYPDIRITLRPDQCAISHLSGGKHLKLITPSGLELLWWNQGGMIETLKTAAVVTARVRLSTNDFGGRTRPQAIIDDLAID